MSEKEITFGLRYAVYGCLTSEFPFGEKLNIVQVASVLRNRGIAYEDYGFPKLRSFLEAMGAFIDVEMVDNNGPQLLVTLNEVADWDAVKNADAVLGLPDDPDGLIVLPEGYSTQWAGDLVGRGLYDLSKIPSDIAEELAGDSAEDLLSFCHIPKALMAKLLDVMPLNIDVYETLDRDWSAARLEGAMRYEDGMVVWPLNSPDAKGNPTIEIHMEPQPLTAVNSFFKPWIVRKIDFLERHKHEGAPTSEIEKFADINWGEFLPVLAGLAQNEEWDLGGGSRWGRFSVLKSYVQLTFHRLRMEDKIAVNKSETFAAFNTGLATARYDDIFACFEKAAKADRWKLVGFCPAGVSGLGKKLVKQFGPLPAPASYFSSKEDLLFDLDRSLTIDYQHILVDNVDRLPLEFLAEETAGNDRAAAAILAIEEAMQDGRGFLRSCPELTELRKAIEEDPRLFRRLRCRFDDAVSVAMRRQRWDYRTATPAYFARANKVSFFLPLDFLDDDVVDNVLVVSLAYPSRNYIGETILTMPQAYSQARLVARPSGWLQPTDVTRALDKNTFIG